MALKDRVLDRSGNGGIVGAIARLILRFLQFVFAITVAGLYGVDLANAHNAHVGADGKWVYAEVIAGLSAATVLVYGALFFVPSHMFFAWDWILFILWVALFGVFGDIYIGSHPTPEQSGQIRMKNAVWIDLINLLLWFITAVYLTIVFFKSRTTRTLHTGRAKV